MRRAVGHGGSGGPDSGVIQVDLGTSAGVHRPIVGEPSRGRSGCTRHHTRRDPTGRRSQRRGALGRSSQSPHRAQDQQRAQGADHPGAKRVPTIDCHYLVDPSMNNARPFRSGRAILPHQRPEHLPPIRGRPGCEHARCWCDGPRGVSLGGAPPWASAVLRVGCGVLLDSLIRRRQHGSVGPNRLANQGSATTVSRPRAGRHRPPARRARPAGLGLAGRSRPRSAGPPPPVHRPGRPAASPSTAFPDRRGTCPRSPW